MVLFFLISLLRSRGEDRREEKRIAGPLSSTVSESEEVMGGVELSAAVVGGFEVIGGVDDSRREA